MKYPQLVSTRAVSAISDWLVTELEQLGVDASSVYSRLLLSLLHTPLQINALDLAEISDNKIGSFTRNKLFISKSGNSNNYRRFSAADTEALKRLAAIDSLLEAVPSDQQLSKIETLVDELSLKLREIEEQSNLDDSDFEIGPNTDNALCNSNVVTTDKKAEPSEDPANRYFNAFPALSDQSKNVYSHKTTSWPQVDSNINKHPHSDQSVNQSQPTAGAISVVKKKSKRRRVAANSTMMAPTLPNQPKSNAINSVRNTRTTGSKANKKKSTDQMWDTDFDGAWEMGRDLIREFVLKQNNRNRSISESDAARFTSLENETVIENGSGINENLVVNETQRCEQIDNDEENLMRVAAAATSSLFGKNFELNVYALNVPDTETTSSSSRFTDSSTQNNNDRMLIRSEGCATPDTLGSWSEIETAGLQREPNHETTLTANESLKYHGVEATGGSDCVDSGCMETNYLAKFNQNMEALWNDCKQNDQNIPAKTDLQLNAYWLNYHNNNATSVAAAATAAVSADQPMTRATQDQFKPFFQPNACPKNNLSGADINPFTSAQPNSLNSNSSSATGGMNLTTSIWSLDNRNNSDDIWVDNPNNNDISFYANARLWELNQFQSKNMNRKLNLYAAEPTDNVYGKTNKITGASSNFDGGNFENASFSKWSDNDTSFLPIQQDACPSPQKSKNEDEIRSNMFENSYFNNYQHAQLMNSSMINGRNMALAEPNIAERSVNQSQNVIKRHVTLSNHSSRSCFKEVEPLSFEARQELHCKTNARKDQQNSAETIEQEDLLTSERSRFRPIKQTYADGYTFDISNKLDHINYERSRSGMLYHDSEVYREWYVYDEEGNGGSRRDTDQSNRNVEFTLKYCVRQNDKSCTTDDLSAPVKYLRIITPTIRLPLKSDSNRIKSFSSLSNANISSLKEHRSYFDSSDSKEMQCDDGYINDGTFDKLIEMSQDGWCLNESRQCCNNLNSVHALWAHCTSCSNDMVSMPAMKDLKDELSADGDEIMSDLKYLIQSISFHSDWEGDDDDDRTLLAECNDDGDIVLEQTPIKCKMTDTNRHLLADMTKLTEYTDETNDELTSNHIYSNVSKLISDLLQPEKAQTLVQAISEKCQQGRLHADDKCLIGQDSGTKKRIIHETKDIKATKNELSCNSSPHSSDHHFGSLWAYNDNSIWRRELSNNNTMGKHMEHETETVNRLGDEWEHANLEKIWKNIPNTEPATNHDNEYNVEQQMHSNMDKTILSTTLLNENKCEIQNALDLNKKTESQSKKLDKFMEHCFRTRDHTQNHKQNLNKNNVNRYDRKRRHSATSQNYFDQLNYALNNNCDAIECIKKLATKTLGDYDGTNEESTATTIITCNWTACDSFCVTSTLSFNNNNNNTNNNNNNSSKNNNNIADDTENFFNCYHKHMQQQLKYHPEQFTDSFNANEPTANHSTTCGTFLVKQVAAMVSRPLTR